MNKAFELILERLEEKKYIVPVNRILDDIIHDKPKELGKLMAYDDAIKIVQEVAEEYNGGWIPCSERLPEESGTYIVNAIENGIVHVTFAKWMPRMKNWNLTGSRAYWKVTAWQPLPEPYKDVD